MKVRQVKYNWTGTIVGTRTQTESNVPEQQREIVCIRFDQQAAPTWMWHRTASSVILEEPYVIFDTDKPEANGKSILDRYFNTQAMIKPKTLEEVKLVLDEVKRLQEDITERLAEIKRKLEEGNKNV